jgi:sugar phosphate isomerase/epimerase
MVLALLSVSSLLAGAQKKLDNVFYCQNTMWQFENKPQTAQQKAKLMKKIGFDGLEGFGYQDFFELKKALDKEGLSMPVNYVELNFNEKGALKGNSLNEIKKMIRTTDKGAVMYFFVRSQFFKNDKNSGDEVLIPILRDLADYAQPYGVKLCVYPHISFYTETLEHAVKLAKMVKRKNYGAALNLCHLLKIEGSEGIDQKIKDYTPYLFAVNICGADDGDTQQYGWDRLIQPLGQGSFDTYGFVKSLKDNGYDGPFGIQCYSLTGDVVETLTETMEIWEGYKKKYAKREDEKVR